MSSSSYIDILLPYKEMFTPSNAGAVATVVSDLAYNTTLNYKMDIYGRHLFSESFSQLSYIALKPKWPLIYGHNLGLARSYIANLKKRTSRPSLIEVHGRCNVARFIAKNCSTNKVALFLHNDPRKMKGSKSLQERLWFARNLAGIFANSAYIRDCFLDGFKTDEISETPIFLTPLGAERKLTKRPNKKKIIIIASRIVPEKGILEAATALKEVLPDFPDWKVKIIGAKHFKTGKVSEYEKSVMAVLAPLQEQAEIAGFLPLNQVDKELARAAIAIVPSIWQEPASRAVLEALANGCALITTRVGGIPERAENRAMLVEKPDITNLAIAIKTLLSEPSKLKKLHDIAWNDYPFDCVSQAKIMDAARKKVISKKPEL